MAVPVKLSGGRPEVDGPRAPETQVASRADNRGRIVLFVERLLTFRIGQGVERLFRTGVDQPRDPDVLGQLLRDSPQWLRDYREQRLT